ncbi:hypothetical protein CONPUDRAFT_156958 [Coniophora puteana RWD-64-598 SS2]|uniref:Uncharacterized protein n=1 Tax=Coniophora puteana (strain RWD-64-598) TaxID=741705 RepID=A0A5M3MEX7_CONPW|nr:uncharacterized protein CONPUDRAFT_156958 [Coniophora puteana RWD-64-598 SS2]EIW77772.1 hypothetical protein CONPUDRAFT_156958 [Coniophora puteana RWD-64-598 SS2]
MEVDLEERTQKVKLEQRTERKEGPERLHGIISEVEQAYGSLESIQKVNSRRRRRPSASVATTLISSPNPNPTATQLQEVKLANPPGRRFLLPPSAESFHTRSLSQELSSARSQGSSGTSHTSHSNRTSTSSRARAPSPKHARFARVRAGEVDYAAAGGAERERGGDHGSGAVGTREGPCVAYEGVGSKAPEAQAQEDITSYLSLATMARFKAVRGMQPQVIGPGEVHVGVDGQRQEGDGGKRRSLRMYVGESLERLNELTLGVILAQGIITTNRFTELEGLRSKHEDTALKLEQTKTEHAAAVGALKGEDAEALKVKGEEVDVLMATLKEENESNKHEEAFGKLQKEHEEALDRRSQEAKESLKFRIEHSAAFEKSSTQQSKVLQRDHRGEAMQKRAAESAAALERLREDYAAAAHGGEGVGCVGVHCVLPGMEEDYHAQQLAILREESEDKTEKMGEEAAKLTNAKFSDAMAKHRAAFQDSRRSRSSKQSFF